MRATLRAVGDVRWTIAGFAAAGFAITFLQSLAYFRLAGHTFAERAALGYSLLQQATANAALLPPPVHPETVAGYLELRAFAPLAIVFAAWALAAAPEPGPAPVSRTLAFALATALAALGACLGVVAGVTSGGESVDGVRLAEAGLLLVALALSCHAICICVARVAPSGPVVAGALMLTLFFVNSLSRIFAQLSALRWLSPFRYYDLSAPLPRGGPFDVGGFAVLVAIGLAGTALAAFLTKRRVVSTRKARPTTYEPARVRLLALPVARDLYAQRVALATFALTFAALGILLVAATRTTIQALLALPRGLAGLPQYIFVLYAQVLGQTWFDASALLVVALVFTFVARWASDDRDGRLEAVLSAPYSRSALLLERWAAVAVTSAIVAGISAVAVGLTSHAMNLGLDSTHLAHACIALVLFSAALAAFGVLFTSWSPKAAGTLFGAVVLAAYLDDQIGAALGLPAWTQNISPFRLLDAPLANGLDGGGVFTLAALALAAIGSSILVMHRHDVGR